MGLHDERMMRCTINNVTNNVPKAFVEDVIRGVPVIPIFTIGSSSHGKTCYLSSIFWNLYHGNIHKVWPGFTFDGLNRGTLENIRKNYVDLLQSNKLPAKNPVKFPEPIIVRFPGMPNRYHGLRNVFFYNPITQRDVIFVFYDVSGDVFLQEEDILRYLPILNRTNSLIFLISLPLLDLQVNETHEKNSVVTEMHSLLQVVTLALESNRVQMKRKKLILSFIWADEMWGHENKYGPLAEKITRGLPTISEMPDYFRDLTSQSKDIERYLSEKYGIFYNLCKQFGALSCVSVSALGQKPNSDGTINNITPYHIMDPILLAMKYEKYL
jgi:hypothetical protein